MYRNSKGEKDMSNAMTAALDLVDPRVSNPREWLLLWSMEHNGGIDEQWLADSGLSQAQAEALQARNVDLREEIRGMQSLGRLFTLESLFELLRQRVMQMLATAHKPAELRSLLGSLRQLPGAGGLLKQLDGLPAGRNRPAAAVAPDQLATRLRDGFSQDQTNLPQVPAITDMAGLPDCSREELVNAFARQAEPLISDDSLPRQQRRQLQRQLDKLLAQIK